MSEILRLAAMHVRHACCDTFDEQREVFVIQAVKARDEYDALRAEVKRLRADNAALEARLNHAQDEHASNVNAKCPGCYHHPDRHNSLGCVDCDCLVRK